MLEELGKSPSLILTTNPKALVTSWTAFPNSKETKPALAASVRRIRYEYTEFMLAIRSLPDVAYAPTLLQ
jgi:hypothetical protein